MQAVHIAHQRLSVSHTFFYLGDIDLEPLFTLLEGNCIHFQSKSFIQSSSDILFDPVELGR